MTTGRNFLTGNSSVQAMSPKGRLRATTRVEDWLPATVLWLEVRKRCSSGLKRIWSTSGSLPEKRMARCRRFQT
jgi:hypothetical protein